MAKNRKWGPVLAFGAVTAVLGGIAAYKHRKEIERTLQEIADQMDAWDSSEDFFHDEDAVVHTVTHAEIRPPRKGRPPRRATSWTPPATRSPPRRPRKRNPKSERSRCPLFLATGGSVI